ncbi:Uncharacterised protein [Bordetella pertussis]|nr:Uncharacterised protein [Bordetella pertussis]
MNRAAAGGLRNEQAKKWGTDMLGAPQASVS